jgi:5'-nucleotidase
MRLLLTNDDGLDSPALNALYDRLQRDHEVAVVAPDSEKSGSSHAVTLRRPIRIRQKTNGWFACGGTPADCVLLASLGLVEGPIDLVVAGPNMGPNLGTDIIYSGTVAAARQATLMGHAAIAASLCGDSGPEEVGYSVEFLCRNLNALCEALDSEPDHFLNINFPAGASGPLRVTHPSLRVYNDRIERYDLSPDEFYCFITGPKPESHPEEGSDWDAIAEGGVSLSPIVVHPLLHGVETRYKALEFWTR